MKCFMAMKSKQGIMLLPLMAISYGVAACSSSGGTPADCESYFAAGQAYTGMCNFIAAPTTAVLAACESSVGQCNSSDVSILHEGANCLQMLSDCNYNHLLACVATRSQLSVPCQAAVQTVVNVYNNAAGYPPQTVF